MIINEDIVHLWCDALCVTPEFILNYADNAKEVWLLEIGKVVELNNLCRDSLQVERNPKLFAYCPLSYGEPF